MKNPKSVPFSYLQVELFKQADQTDRLNEELDRYQEGQEYDTP